MCMSTGVSNDVVYISHCVLLCRYPFQSRRYCKYSSLPVDLLLSYNRNMSEDFSGVSLKGKTAIVTGASR